MARSEGEPRGTQSFKRDVATNIAKGAIVLGTVFGVSGAVGAVETEVLGTNISKPKDIPTQIAMDFILGDLTIVVGGFGALGLYLTGVASSRAVDLFKDDVNKK